MNACGEAEKLCLEDGINVILGPLRGEILIDGNKNNMILGFQHLKGTDKVGVGLTTYPTIYIFIQHFNY